MYDYNYWLGLLSFIHIFLVNFENHMISRVLRHHSISKSRCYAFMYRVFHNKHLFWGKEPLLLDIHCEKPCDWDHNDWVFECSIQYFRCTILFLTKVSFIWTPVNKPNKWFQIIIHRGRAQKYIVWAKCRNFLSFQSYYSFKRTRFECFDIEYKVK